MNDIGIKCANAFTILPFKWSLSTTICIDARGYLRIVVSFSNNAFVFLLRTMILRCHSVYSLLQISALTLLISHLTLQLQCCHGEQTDRTTDGAGSNAARRRIEPIRSTKRVEGAMIIDEKKYRESANKPQKQGIHKLAHAKEFSRSLFGNASTDHYLVPPAPGYRREDDTSAFRVREWPAVFTLNCPDVSPLLRPGKPPGMDRGLLIAHKETWDQFVRQREDNPARLMFNETADVLVSGGWDVGSEGI